MTGVAAWLLIQESEDGCSSSGLSWWCSLRTYLCIFAKNKPICLPRRIPAIDHEMAAGDEGGFLGGEEKHRIGDLARLGDALEDMSAAPVGMGVGRGPVHASFTSQTLHDLRPDRSRAYGIDANLIRRQIQGHATRHGGQRRLRGIVSDELRLGDEAGHGGD